MSAGKLPIALVAQCLRARRSLADAEDASHATGIAARAGSVADLTAWRGAMARQAMARDARAEADRRLVEALLAHYDVPTDLDPDDLVACLEASGRIVRRA